MTVDSLADTVALDGQCTLREAVMNHNAVSQVNPDCPKGKKNDRIAFSVAGSVVLGSELPALKWSLTITGGSLTIDGGGVDRIMETTDGAKVVLQSIAL